MRANAHLEPQAAAVQARFLDAPAIAAMLSVNRRTLRRMIVKGDFPPADLKLSSTLLRWKVETVENWIASHCQ
jgi:predicted DNA-binding transcriptional regulator AlpA